MRVAIGSQVIAVYKPQYRPQLGTLWGAYFAVDVAGLHAIVLYTLLPVIKEALDKLDEI